MRGLPVAAVMAAGGSGLLLVTPPGAFARVVPILVAAGSLTLLAQPALTARRHRRSGDSRLLLLVSIGALSIYSGYFGAGSGIMVLATVAVLLDPRLPQANAVKNMLLGASAVASAVVFLLAGPIDWHAVAPLAVGLFAGSTMGPIVARRAPQRLVRWSVAALGLVLAVRLWLYPE